MPDKNILKFNSQYKPVNLDASVYIASWFPGTVGPY